MLRISLFMILLSGCSLFFEEKKSQDAGTGSTVDASPSTGDATDANPNAIDADVAVADAAQVLACAPDFTHSAEITVGVKADISFTAIPAHAYLTMAIMGPLNPLQIIDELPITGGMPPFEWNYQFTPDEVGTHEASFSRRESIDGPDILLGTCMFLVTN